MTRLATLLLAAAVTAATAAASAQTPQTIPANVLLPNPPPTAPVSEWTASSTRYTLTDSPPGAVLRGWDFKPAAGPRDGPLVLFFNGNGMILDAAQPLYEALAGTGGELCVFDYRGLGFSTGTPDIPTFRQDALHLYDSLVAARPGRQVVVYGFSLGTAMAAYVASERRVAGVILAGAIASAAEELPVYSRAVGFPVEAGKFAPAPESIEAFDETGMIARSAAPLLVLHGEADRLVPIRQGREVFAASRSQRKRFVALPGVAHGETSGSAESLRAVAAFLAEIAGKG